MAVISSNRVGFLAIDSSSLGHDGVSAYSLQLKPDIIALQCDSSGATIAQQDIQIYFGAFLGSNRVASSAVNFSNIGDFNGQIAVSYVNATTDADGVITMTIQAGCELGGKMADALDCTFAIGDDNFLISKVITLAKIIPGPSGGQGQQGEPGQNAQMYWLNSDTAAFTKDTGGNYDPEYVTINALVRDGNNGAQPYACKFQVEEKDASGNITQTYISRAAESSIQYAPSDAAVIISDDNLDISSPYYTVDGTNLTISGASAASGVRSIIITMLDPANNTPLDSISIPVGYDGQQGSDGVNGQNGKDGLAFVMYCAEGDTFDDVHPGDKTLKIYVQDGIEGIGYTWYKRDGAGWINKGSAATLTVTRTDVDGIGDYRCDVSYDTSKAPISTYMTIKDKLDVYQAEITTVTGPVINSENPFIVAVGNIYKNGELQDTETFSIQSTVLPTLAQQPLYNGFYYHISSMSDGFVYQEWNGSDWEGATRATDYTYKWFVYSGGNPNAVTDAFTSGDRKVVAFTPEMVTNNMLIRLEVYKDGTKISEQSCSFVDMNDPIISAQEPEQPAAGQLWINTSAAPPTIQIFNGGAWQDIKAANNANNTVFISTPNSKQKDGYLYKQGDIWVVTNGEQIKRYVGPISDRQDTGTYYENNTILVCIQSKEWNDNGINICDYSDWSDINNIGELTEIVKKYQQVLKQWKGGLYMFAEDDETKQSSFYSKLTSGELGFYSRAEAGPIPTTEAGLSSNDQKVVWISTNSLCAKRAEIKENVKITYDDGVTDNHSLYIQIGNFRWQTEPDGSFSLVKVADV